MQRLILILLAFLALFTFIRAFDTVEAAGGSFAGSPEKTGISIEKSVEILQ